MLDFTSLLLATAISGFCLSLTMLAFRMSARSGDYMITWSIGLLIIVSHVLAYWIYVNHPNAWLGSYVAASLPIGVAAIYASTGQFAFGTKPFKPALMIVVPYLAIVLPLLVAGYDGAALMVQNATVGILFVLCGQIHFDARHEAPFSMSALSVLYVVLGLSFGLCGAVLLFGGEWRIGHAPDNFAERVNIIISVVCTTAIGALSVTVDQSRLARKHRIDAMTDPLTGLLNRRALFQAFGGKILGSRHAAVVFDLDHFKSVNDDYGHACGDEVIRMFAQILRDAVRNRDTAARLGGEEFVLILSGTTSEHARMAAERIALAFSARVITTPQGQLRCTVSAGIGFPGASGASFEEVLSRADKELYEAKRAGRNRVEAGELRLAG